MIILNPLYNHEQSQEIRESIVNLFNEKIKGTDNEQRFKENINGWLQGSDIRLQNLDRIIIRDTIFGRFNNKKTQF